MSNHVINFLVGIGFLVMAAILFINLMKKGGEQSNEAAKGAWKKLTDAVDAAK